MTTYQIISRRNGKVLGIVQAFSRQDAVQSWATPNAVSAVII